MSLLDVENLGRTFGEAHAVREASFSLERGEIVALVGESGSGKSTTARMVARLLAPTTGRVLLEGSATVPELAYRSKVQMVFQDPFGSLNPARTIGHHLTRPLLLHRRATRKQAPQAVAALLETVGLDPSLAVRHPHELSGGQRQRVAIARAFAVEPLLVVADEPVSMLDVSIRIGVLNLMERLRDERETAFLYITHDVASARYLGGRMLVMYGGHIVEGGPARVLTGEPAHPYTRLLLAAVPNPRRGSSSTVTRPTGPRPSTGCPFTARCPLVTDLCRTTMPPVTRVADGHWARCHALGKENQ
ncbi:ABC transporter ATP-binding protein [Nonomuraea soli]|uniref:Peptide/nickel transport system ATP-binding protein n=1 Tax=Nonomuraea soli TaxID=1032476 RepID=A0A7W0HTD2_9ACTN|nr:ABC transporter ATP-binding protein [Nonomuraea soli]MBA2894596.1 peptide/nickel transport system ATP-binding protein [Nonomuraea soli]